MKKNEKVALKHMGFLLDSNKIEGEDWPFAPTTAMKYAMNLVGTNVSEDDIKKIHELHRDDFNEFVSLHEYLDGDAILYGEYRKCDVYIGGKPAMNPRKLPQAMKDLCKEWKNLDAWEVHCKFEKIHPFEDLNGRVGRLLWLIKAIEEGYNFSISFLHTFYYQTLKHQS